LSIAARPPSFANSAGVKTVPGFERRTRRVMSASMPDAATGLGRAVATRFVEGAWAGAFMSEK
jgi:hypothetical protein